MPDELTRYAAGEWPSVSAWYAARDEWMAEHPDQPLPLCHDAPMDWEALGIGPDEALYDRQIVKRGELH